MKRQRFLLKCHVALTLHLNFSLPNKNQAKWSGAGGALGFDPRLAISPTSLELDGAAGSPEEASP